MQCRGSHNYSTRVEQDNNRVIRLSLHQLPRLAYPQKLNYDLTDPESQFPNSIIWQPKSKCILLCYYGITFGFYPVRRIAEPANT